MKYIYRVCVCGLTYVGMLLMYSTHQSTNMQKKAAKCREETDREMALLIVITDAAVHKLDDLEEILEARAL